jgi:pantoate--beta-alanine ligase
MKVVRSIAEMRSARRGAERDVGFAATMGALHAGHMSLVIAARAAHETAVVSIFVNPLQFGPAEDFEAYPRDETRDLELLEAQGVDVVFVPQVAEMFPPGRTTTVSAGPLGDILEGRARPGHFDGVCTVVAKLFNIVEPVAAYFGQKDAQQVAVVKSMVRDLNFDIAIVVGPTVREPTGLAMSSRNAYLSRAERNRAEALFEALNAGHAVLEGGGDPATAEKTMETVLDSREGIEADYAVARDPDTFAAPTELGPVLLAVAARVGKARLIDNMVVDRR